MHSDFGEEVMEQSQKAGVSIPKSLLQERGIYMTAVG
jgi:hypothetical protein